MNSSCFPLASGSPGRTVRVVRSHELEVDTPQGSFSKQIFLLGIPAVPRVSPVNSDIIGDRLNAVRMGTQSMCTGDFAEGPAPDSDCDVYCRRTHQLFSKPNQFMMTAIIHCHHKLSTCIFRSGVFGPPASSPLGFEMTQQVYKIKMAQS